MMNEMQYAENMYNLVLEGKKASSEIESDDRMSTKRNFEVLKEKVKIISKTSKLWLEYKNVIELVKRLILSDCIGNWQFLLLVVILVSKVSLLILGKHEQPCR